MSPGKNESPLFEYVPDAAKQRGVSGIAAGDEDIVERVCAFDGKAVFQPVLQTHARVHSSVVVPAAGEVPANSKEGERTQSAGAKCHLTPFGQVHEVSVAETGPEVVKSDVSFQ